VVPRASRAAGSPRGLMTIHLRRRLPDASSDPPGCCWASRPGVLPPAPCRVLLRAGFTWPAGHPAAGGLLPHHFTVASVAAGCVFSVALSLRFPSPGVTRRPALRSSDFPRPGAPGRGHLPAIPGHCSLALRKSLIDVACCRIGWGARPAAPPPSGPDLLGAAEVHRGPLLRLALGRILRTVDTRRLRPPRLRRRCDVKHRNTRILLA
jgi:hypothetical protein